MPTKSKAKSKANAKAPLGQGGRFAAVEKAAAKGGATNPAAVAAAIGRKKYGKKRFQAMAAKGRKDQAYGTMLAVGVP